MTFHKYPKIFVLGREENIEMLKDGEDELIIEEKLDGANFRFMVKDGKIIFGSRGRSLGDDTQEIGGQWKRACETVRKALQGKNTKEYEGKIFFGECMVQHSMAYDWERTPPVIGFDVMDISTGMFIGYEDKAKLFSSISLPIAPLVRRCKAKELGKIDETSIPKSAFCSGNAEGIVIKNYTKQVLAKYVTERFKEKNALAFGGGKKFAETDSERIVAIYCTNARIEKAIFKLIDEGQELGMKMMMELPKIVVQDIFEENWKEICYSNWTANFRKIRSLVSSRCAAVLRNMIVNNAINR